MTRRDDTADATPGRSPRAGGRDGRGQSPRELPRRQLLMMRHLPFPSAYSRYPNGSPAATTFRWQRTEFRSLGPLGERNALPLVFGRSRAITGGRRGQVHGQGRGLSRLCRASETALSRRDRRVSCCRCQDTAQNPTSASDVTTSKSAPMTVKCRRPQWIFWFSLVRRSSLSSVLLVSRTK